VLLLVAAERQQRGGDDADPLRVEAMVDAPPRQFLAVHELLQDAGVAAAELRRIPGKSQP